MYICVESGVLTPVHTERSGRYFLMIAFHNFGWGWLFHRLAGIYWEPGAYQIILNSVLLLYFKEITSLELEKKLIKNIFVIVIATFCRFMPTFPQK